MESFKSLTKSLYFKAAMLVFGKGSLMGFT